MNCLFRLLLDMFFSNRFLSTASVIIQPPMEPSNVSLPINNNINNNIKPVVQQEPTTTHSVSSHSILGTSSKFNGKLDLDLRNFNNDGGDGLIASSEESLNNENIEEQEDICAVCYDNRIDTVLLPCKHQHLCYDCSTKVEDCPTCRSKISERIQVYR